MRNPIEPLHFNANIHQIWSEQWLLLTSGDFNAEYNAMTVGWGSFGVMWKKPFAQIVVRPTRHTYKFCEKYDSFTLSAFGPEYRDAVLLLGTKSGKSGNKIAESGLTPAASEHVRAPGFKEAELVVECKKIYWQDFNPENFLSDDINLQYPEKDYHRIYYGEILGVSGMEKYSSIT